MASIMHIGMVHTVDDIRIVRKECKTLSANGYEVTYLTGYNGENNINERCICGTNVYTYNTSIMNNKIPIISYRLARYRICKRLLTKLIAFNADVYHIHELELFPLAKSLKKMGKKVIFDQHEDSPGQAYNKGLEKYHNQFIAKIMFLMCVFDERIFVKWSDRVIVASDMIADNIIRRYHTNKVYVIHNYADSNTTQCDMSNYFERERIACYAGMLYERRGIEYIIKAMDNVNGFFEFAGPMNEEIKNKYANIKELEKCKYLGELSRSEVNELYGRSKVGIINNLDLPYHRNSNPNKLFEYMACGLPIICSSIPAWARIIKEAKCGLIVDSKNSKEISDALNYIFDHPEEAREMGENGYKCFLEKYNWAAEKSILIGVYEDLLKG